MIWFLTHSLTTLFCSFLTHFHTFLLFVELNQIHYFQFRGMILYHIFSSVTSKVNNIRLTWFRKFGCFFLRLKGWYHRYSPWRPELKFISNSQFINKLFRRVTMRRNPWRNVNVLRNEFMNSSHTEVPQ